MTQLASSSSLKSFFFSQHERNHHVLLRGPVLVASASTALAWPYLSISVLCKIIILTIGAAVMYSDMTRLIQKQVKATIKSTTKDIVLDDILRAIFDPEYGIIPVIIGTFLGNSAMYALPMSPEQKTKLMQATLGGEYEDARTVLCEPGGCRALLPQSMQTWLEEDSDDDDDNNVRTTPRGFLKEGEVNHNEDDEDATTATPIASARGIRVLHDTTTIRVESVTAASSSSKDDYRSGISGGGGGSSGSGSAQSTYCSEESGSISDDAHDDDDDAEEEVTGDNGTSDTNTTNKRSRATPTASADANFKSTATPEYLDPIQIMATIIKDLISQKVKIAAASIPEQSMETVGLASLSVIAMHIFLRRRRALSILPTSVSGIFNMLLAGTTVGSFSGIMMKHVLQGTIHDRESLMVVASAILTRIINRLQHVSNQHRQKIKLAFALLVMSRSAWRRRSGTTH